VTCWHVEGEAEENSEKRTWHSDWVLGSQPEIQEILLS